MLDMKWIRDNEAAVQRAAELRGFRLSVRELIRADERKRGLLQTSEELRQTRNRLSQDIRLLAEAGRREEAERLKRLVKDNNARLTAAEAELTEAEREWEMLMLELPNLVSPDTPVGLTEADNQEVRRYSAPPAFEFEPLDHVALGTLHGLIDIPRGVKTAGTRNYYLTGMGVRLHRAVQQLALDLLETKGFALLEVPLMVRTEAMTNAGFFPLGQDQAYGIEGEDKWLVGTSEAPLISYYSGEIVDVAAPLKLAAASTCFRSEVGSAGKDVHGLYRVHQFAKVEQVVLCEADPGVSGRMLEEITGNAEELLRLLELPYRVVAVCAGDMSHKAYKQYDIETWMPSRQAYGETHSSSNLHDYQARRSQIRYRGPDGKLRHCHTLNNTAVASPRILIPLLENHQEEDGSVRIPQALRPYLNGMERLAVK